MSSIGDLNFSVVSDFVAHRMTELDVPSLAIGVQVRGKIVYEEAFGFACVETGECATPRTPYSIASITKPMIGTVLAMLSEESLIDLYAPVDDYLGDARLTAWVGDSNEATVARLANHTAGLPLYFQFFFADEATRPPSWQETVKRYGNVVRVPGERHIYSNIGYGMLGFAIEQVTGCPLSEVLSSRLFAPLRMENSFFAAGFDRAPSYATRYDKDNKPLPHYITDHPAASEAYCSVLDLLKFGTAHLALGDSTILTTSSMLEMQAPLGPRDSEQGYGLGWVLGRTTTGDRIFGHSGGMDGVSTRLVILPALEAVVVVLCNSDSAITTETVTKIYEVLGVQTGQGSVVEPDRAIPDVAMGRWSGSIHTYEGDIPMAMDISTEGIRAEIDGQPIESDAHFENGEIIGSLLGQIHTSDALRAPHTLPVALQRRGDQMIGALTARLEGSGRIGHALSYPAVLTMR